jgi:poly[(R)-3-hydroxyalkanoate] polymerase subunit PhaC
MNDVAKPVIGAKTRERAPEKKTRERAPEKKTRERAPEEKTRERAPEEKTRERAPEEKTRERAPEEKTREQAPEEKTRERAPEKTAPKSLAATAGMLSDRSIDALADIVKRTNQLGRLHAEKLKSADGYQVIDPKTVTSTFQEFMRTAQVDPARLVSEQFKLWADMGLLWQRTAARYLFNIPAEPVITPAPGDKRFKSELWVESSFFDYIKQFYLLMSRYVQASVDDVTGVDSHTHHKQQFYTRQFLSALSPANFAASNPVVVKETLESRGENLIKGFRNFIEDLERGGGRLSLKMTDLSAFRFGENIASSPGKVVFQNELMQLIQYAPTTPMVHCRPLLIVPPWINKFYILDLKPKNSFIKWCTDQGFTVFVISWVNPGAELADKGFADYLLEGPLAALDAIEQATDEAEANVVGYCIGGTLTASALAYMAATKDRRITSATFFTTLLDFSDVGDISVFVDDDQLQLADQHMDRLGYFEGHHMAEAFNLLRENDLLWFFFVNNYLMGRDPSAFDLLYWNSDSTRMPATMQSFYLRNMYHRNVLKEPGRINLANVPIDLGKIDVPAYFLSTREDHIAPWHTTYAGARLLSGPVRFVLGASGHVAGVINPPSANKYGYWTNKALAADPEAWLERAEYCEGSWWTDWTKWMARHGGGQVPARQPGSGALPAIEDAPGSYVQVRVA